MDRTDKELAYLHDLYVAPDWSERFAELFDEHVKLPLEGRALYVAAGTGGHALALKERAGKELTFICVDESDERLVLARAKSAALKADGQVDFRAGQLDALAFEDEQFELVLGDVSMVAPERLPEILAEMVRVSVPKGTVALNLTTASSFGEFFSIYWEALCCAGLEEHAAHVETFINELPTISDVEKLAAQEALDDVQSWTNLEEFSFASGEAFTDAPLVKEFLLKNWLAPLPDEDARTRVLAEIGRIIDDERHDAPFILSIKATLVVGHKAD